MSKAKMKTNAKKCSVRISVSTLATAKTRLKKANDKDCGRTIKFEDLVSLALGLVTDEHLKLLQEASLSHEDRKELLRQKYIATRGPISKDEFTGFMMTADFQKFVLEQEIPAKYLTPEGRAVA